MLGKLEKQPQYTMQTIPRVVADVWNSLHTHATKLMLLSSPTISVMAFHGLHG